MNLNRIGEETDNLTNFLRAIVTRRVGTYSLGSVFVSDGLSRPGPLGPGVTRTSRSGPPRVTLPGCREPLPQVRHTPLESFGPSSPRKQNHNLMSFVVGGMCVTKTLTVRVNLDHPIEDLRGSSQNPYIYSGSHLKQPTYSFIVY